MPCTAVAHHGTGRSRLIIGALMAPYLPMATCRAAPASRYGTRTLLDAVSLGVDEGDAIGVVGRNGDGKTTLLRVLTGARSPTPGGSPPSGLSVGISATRADDFARGATVRGVIVGGRPDHIWAAEPGIRDVVGDLLSGVDWTRRSARLSGGERRRVAAGRGADRPDTTCSCSTSRPTTSTSR